MWELNGIPMVPGGAAADVWAALAVSTGAAPPQADKYSAIKDM
jgi:hypothetical protein